MSDDAQPTPTPKTEAKRLTLVVRDFVFDTRKAATLEDGARLWASLEESFASALTAAEERGRQSAVGMTALLAFEAGQEDEREACAQVAEACPLIHRESRRKDGGLVVDGLATRAGIVEAIRSRALRPAPAGED